MRLAMLTVVIVIISGGRVQSQFPGALQAPPASSSAPPLNLTITPSQPPTISNAPSFQQTGMTSGPVKPGEQVRVLRGTYIRSGPGEQAYSCGVLEAGAMVTILEFPSPGSEYTPIAAPATCFSLIPESALFYAMFRPKDLFVKPQKTKAAVETLIDGEPANGEYLSSKYTLPKGSLVSVVNEKKVKVLGKEKIYCVIRVGGKEKRFVRTADLEGVVEAARAANQPLNMNSPLHANTQPLYGNVSGGTNNEPWPPMSTTPQQQEQLSPQLVEQINAADQSYQTAMRYGAWEDARMRYQHLLGSEVLSVRILAKNRLEFIGELQRHPPVVSTSLSPQQGNQYQPMNREPWIPGSQAPARPTSIASTPLQPAPTKDIVIRSTPPVAAASPPPAAGSSSPVNIPLYTDNSGVISPPPASHPAAGTPNPARAAVPANVPTAKREKTTGRLHRAVQYDGFNQLYWLANSQGTATYFLRAMANSKIRLGDYEGKIVEVEGVSFQAIIDGQTRSQINVDRIRAVQ